MKKVAKNYLPAFVFLFLSFIAMPMALPTVASAGWTIETVDNTVDAYYTLHFPRFHGHIAKLGGHSLQLK